MPGEGPSRAADRPPDPSQPGGAIGRLLLGVAGTALAYWAAAWIGLRFATVGSSISLVWPPSGVAVAILVLQGARLWPGVLLGAFFANAATGVPLAAAALMAGGNTLEAWIATALIRRFAAPHLTLDDTREVRAFVLIAAPLAPVGAALVGTTALAVTGAIPWDRFATGLGTWWIGDSLGILVVAPALVTWLDPQHAPLERRRLGELVLIVAACLLVSPLAVGVPGVGPLSPERAYPYLFFPLVIWAGFRSGARGASLVTLIVAALTVGHASRGAGPFLMPSPAGTMLALLGYLGVLAITGILFAGAVQQRARAEEAARQGQQLLRDVIRNAPVVLLLVDRAGRFTFSDGQGLAGAGLQPGQLVGRSALEAYGSIPIVKPDGGTILGGDAIRAVLAGATVSGLTSVGETTYDNRFLPMRDARGEVTGMIGVSVDITERRRAETRLRQAQKLEALGQLAGGVAHDFNNVLTAILSVSELLLDDPQLGPGAAGDLEEIRRSALRAAELTRQLLAFSRHQVLEPVALDLNAVIREVSKMLARLIGEDVALDFRLAEGLGTVIADPGQMQQVVVNLAVNARDAMPRGGRLRIETSRLELPAPAALDGTEVPAGSWVCLDVSDTGEGMDAATLARIFEPFFTTKPVGRGTGLGLATVYGILQQSGGHVTVSSAPGAGSRFRVLLPRSTAPVALAVAGRAARPGRGETVLLVEDEPALRRLVERTLSGQGYRVLSAAGGPEALALFEQHGAGIALLVTDVIMPEMSGRELVGELSRRRPELRVLYLSGYTDGLVLREAAVDGRAGFLQKPFTGEALARKVREQLDRP